MRHLYLSVILVGLMATANPLAANAAEFTDTYAVMRQSEEDLVKAAVLDYFQGSGEADLERLNRGFAEEVAVMVGPAAEGPGFRRWEMSDIIPSWASNENPIGVRTDFEFISVDIADDRIAVVLFRSTDRFYDALTLIKQDGSWQIVAKAFVTQ